VPDDVATAIRALRDDIKEDFGHVREIFDLRYQALAERVTKLEDATARDATERRATRKWLIGAVVLPSFGMLVMIVLTVWGPR
jgi:hypothetical protein